MSATSMLTTPPSISTARTIPSSTMSAPSSGSITPASASRTASSVNRVAASMPAAREGETSAVASGGGWMGVLTV